MGRRHIKRDEAHLPLYENINQLVAIFADISGHYGSAAYLEKTRIK